MADGSGLRVRDLKKDDRFIFTLRASDGVYIFDKPTGGVFFLIWSEKESERGERSYVVDGATPVRLDRRKAKR